MTDEELLIAANIILSRPAATWAERRAQLDEVLALAKRAEEYRKLRRGESIEDRIARGEDVYM